MCASVLLKSLKIGCLLALVCIGFAATTTQAQDCTGLSANVLTPAVDQGSPITVEVTANADTSGTLQFAATFGPSSILSLHGVQLVAGETKQLQVPTTAKTRPNDTYAGTLLGAQNGSACTFKVPGQVSVRLAGGVVPVPPSSVR